MTATKKRNRSKGTITNKDSSGTAEVDEGVEEGLGLRRRGGGVTVVLGCGEGKIGV